VHKALKALSVL